MKLFTTMQIKEAIAHALAGGQALHVWLPCAGVWNVDAAPECFRRAARNGKPFAHLFDQDAERLKKTARMLGVNVVHVDHPGDRMQHVDLCGRPLDKAVAVCVGSSAPTPELTTAESEG